MIIYTYMLTDRLNCYPGVYKLKNGDRAYKAIKKAGGLTKNAKKNNINLAETVVDAQNIYVMSKKEYKKESFKEKHIW